MIVGDAFGLKTPTLSNKQKKRRKAPATTESLLKELTDHFNSQFSRHRTIAA